MPDITLNDFRNILGSRNDGDVIFKTDPNGVETLGKVNYGRVFKHEKITASAEMNRKVRDAFLSAIDNSVEGKLMSQDVRAHIQELLGLGDLETYNRPLKRRVIRDVINLIDLSTRGDFDAMIKAECKAITDKGVVNFAVQKWAQETIAKTAALATAQGILRQLPVGGFRGFTPEQMAKFVNNNLLSIQQHLFDRLFWRGLQAVQGRDERPSAALGTKVIESVGLDNVRSFVQKTLAEMMASFAKHREPPTRTSLLHDLVEGKYFHPDVNDKVAVAFKNDFDELDALVTQLFGNVSKSFRTMNLSRIGLLIAPTIKMACSDAFVKNLNNLQTARKTLTDTLNTMGFPKLTSKELAQIDSDLPTEKKLVTRFRDAFLGRLETLMNDTRRPIDDITPEEFIRLAGEEWSKILDASDPEKAVERYIRNELMARDPKAMQDASLATALASFKANPALLKALQMDMLRDGATELNASIKKMVADAVKAEFEDAAKARDQTFAMLGEAKMSDNGKEMKCTFEEASFVKVRVGKTDAESNLFRGKVLTLVTILGRPKVQELGLFQPNLDAYVSSPENDALVEREVAKLSAEDVRFAYYFVAKGCAKAEATDFLDFGGRERPLFNGLREGIIDIRDMTPNMMKFLGSAYTFDPEGATTVLVEPHRPGSTQGEQYAWTMNTIRDALKAQHCERLLRGSTFDKPLFTPEMTAGRGSWTIDMYGEGSLGAALLIGGDFGGKETGVEKILGFLKDAGMKPADLDNREGYLRAHVLSRVVSFHNDRIDGALEWAARSLGKSVADASTDELIAFVAKASAGQISDPLDKLAGPAKKVSGFFSGTLRLAEAGFTPADLVSIRNGLRELAGGAKAATVKIAGFSVTFSETPTKALVATLEANGKRLPIRSMLNVGNFALQIENSIVDQAGGAVDPAILKAILPKPGDATVGIARARELCTKVLVAKFGLPAVTFASVSTERLCTMAAEAVDGTLRKEACVQELPKSYNGADTIELNNAYIQAKPETQALVKTPPVAQGRSLEERQNRDPDANDVRNFLADLVMNSDTWSFDGAKEGNGRLQDVFKAWAPEWAKISADPDRYLQSLPESVRADFREFVEASRGQLPDEARIDALVKTVIDKLQGSVNNVFATNPHVEKSLWQQSTGEMLGTNGLDTSTPNGRFLQTVLSKYFTSGDRIEQRASLAAFLRNTDETSSEAKQVAELLKGAGPLLQKMLQGLAIESFGVETQLALKDMKSRLPSIPDDVVKAQMLELIRSSAGNIKSIEVVRSLGAATVGQAFLCHIKTSKHPITGEDVVIKLRRPNVMTSVQREHALFAEIAKAQGEGMPETFEMQYRGVLEELDFTHEAGNVDLGLQAYEKPTTSDDEQQTVIRSMSRHQGVPPTEGALVLSKVNGTTFDAYISATKDRINEIVGAQELGLPGEENRVSAVKKELGEIIQVRVQLSEVRKGLLENRKRLAKFTDVWVSNALLGNGLMHGDLHAGNLMTDQKVLTVIDYGNALRLSPEQQKGILRLMTSTMAAVPKDFIKALSLMLPKDGPDQAKLAEASDELERQLTEAFSRGNLFNGASRLAAAVALVQRAKVGLPQELVCFTQSLFRLKATMSALDDDIRLVDNNLAILTLDPDVTNPPEDVAGLTMNIDLPDGTQVDVLKLVDDVVKAWSGETGKGVNMKALNAARRHFSETVYAKGSGSYGGKDSTEASRTFLKGTLDDIPYLQGLAKRYAKFSFSNGGAPYLPSEIRTMTQNLDVYRKAIESGDEKKVEEMRAEYGNHALMLMASIYQQIDQKLDNGEITLEPAQLAPFEQSVATPIANQIGRTIQVLTGKDVDLNGNQFIVMGRVGVAFAQSGGTFGVTTLAFGVEAALTANETFSTAVAAARTRNSSRPDRVPAETMLALENAGREYRAPAKETKEITVVDIVTANILAAREALQAQRHADAPVPLTEAEAEFFADILAASSELSGKSLAKSVKALSPADIEAVPDADVQRVLRALAAL